MLNVLVRADGAGDWMWSPEITAGDVGLVRIPTYAFDSMVEALPTYRYTSLPRPDKGYTFQNRFVGSHVLYGTGSGWWNEKSDSKLFAYNYNRAGRATEIARSHSVDRIEAIGNDLEPWVQ